MSEEKIIVKNAVKRKAYWVYFIDKEGNLKGYDIRKVNTGEEQNANKK